MRTGIVTFHRASNYGAVLQAYALQQTLGSLEKEPEVIDYRTPRVEFDHQPRYAWKKAGVLRGTRAIQGKVRRVRLFNSFRERALKLTDVVTDEDLPDIRDDYDAFVVGSDQVWSEAYADLDPHLFLDFVTPSKRWSYACSPGMEQPSERQREVFGRYLGDFREVSFREQSGRRFLSNSLGLDSRVDLDPTLLLQRSEWEAFSEAPAKKNYILLYTVPRPLKLIELARHLSESLGKEVIYLNNGYLTELRLHRVRYVTPEQFVGWFANADLVLTNSFHGTAFSLLHHRDFVVEVDSQRGSNNRSLELLEACGLSDRALKVASPTAYHNMRREINWDVCQCLLNSMGVDSLKYLSSIG